MNPIWAVQTDEPLKDMNQNPSFRKQDTASMPAAVHSVLILSNEHLRGEIFRLTLASEWISARAKPGQFLHVRVGNSSDPLLRRPLSIHEADPSARTVRVLYQVVGPGTQALSHKTSGDRLDCLGPLGRGFWPEPGRGKALLIAGGIGIAPFPLLARELLGAGCQVQILAGWKTAGAVSGLDGIEAMGVPVALATEDGTEGFAGTVIDLLRDRMSGRHFRVDEHAFYACGPNMMLASLAAMAGQHGIPCQVSLEERMACGIGACHSCAVLAAQNHLQYKLVCRDGPVFHADEVKLE